MNYVVAPPAVVSLAINGLDERFPVRRIFCIGRNYEEHAKEMGFTADREAPFYFMKPADSIVDDGGDIPYPPGTANFQHEIELVAAIGTGGRDIPVEQALDHVFGYAVGNDLTRRDLQIAAREKGRPWDVGKAVDHSAAVGIITPASLAGHPSSGRIWLSVNGETRQDGDLSQLVWSIAELVSYLSKLNALSPGDLIFTGTPAGVGAVVRGDILEGGVDGFGRLTNRIV